MIQSEPADRKLFLARHYGFCSGVRRALKFVDDLLEQSSPEQTICVYNEIVHNNFVVSSLKKRGVRFITGLSQAPDNAIVVWSAHGVPPQLKQQAAIRGLKTVDATCPRVQKLHELANRYSLQGAAVIFIGHADHPETIGVAGCGNVYTVANARDCADLPQFESSRPITVLTQTTWSKPDIDQLIAELRKRFPALEAVSGICHATFERQNAVHELITDQHIEQLLVIGSATSSNSKRLCEIARSAGIPAHLLDSADDLANIDLSSVVRLGITAGASAPEELLQTAVSKLKNEYNFLLV